MQFEPGLTKGIQYLCNWPMTMIIIPPKNYVALLVLLILCIREVSAEVALSIFHKQCKGDTDVFNIHFASLSCYGACTWGSQGAFTAKYTLGEDLSSSLADVELSVLTVPGWNGTIDICNWGGTFSNSTTCPEAGTYTEYATVTLPGKRDAIYSKYLLWMSVSVYAVLDFQDDYGDYSVVCEFKVNGRRYTSMSEMTATSALLFFGIVMFHSRRRRRVAIADDCESSETTTHFVEMGNVDVSNETEER